MRRSLLGAAASASGLLLRRPVAALPCATQSLPRLLSGCAHAPALTSAGPLLRPAPARTALSTALLQPRSLSSSAAGLERAGMPRLEFDSRGRPQGPQKGGKGRKSLSGVLAIRNTWNNTHVAISDSRYKLKGWVTGGSVGFKKSKRASQFATEKCMTEAFRKAKALGIRRVSLRMSGPAIMLRKPLFKQIRDEVGLRIMKLRMTDNVPHGGCKPRKSRRRKWKTKARKAR
jgi:small subunit ribosomal protein S11